MKQKRSETLVPTEADWGDYYSDLDGEYAHRNFAGHTNEEMLPRYREHVLMRSEDLSNMPGIPFRYYILGFRDLVLARIEAPDDPDCFGSDAASCFLNLVLRKLEGQPNDVLPIMPELLPAARYVAENQVLYEASESIYGNFRDTFERIEALYIPHRNDEA